MKEITIQKLKEAQDICDKEEQSTEYMIRFMQDYAKVSFDCIMKYINKTWKEKK
jgi:hypothetical protein